MTSTDLKRIKRWLVVCVAIICLFVLGYLASSHTRLLPAFFRLPAPLPAPAETRDERWRQDLAYLAAELPRLHVDPFHRVSRSEFEQAIDALYADIPNLNDHEITLRLMHVVAMLGDAHTKAIPPASLPAHTLPLRLYWFRDGIGVTAASPAYRQAIGAKVAQINGIDVGTAVERLRGLVAYENESGFRDDIVRYLLIVEVLQAFDIVPDDAMRVPVTFENSDGVRFVLDVAPVESDNLGDMVSPELQGEQIPLHKRHSDRNYWFEYLEDSQTIYVQYRRCSEMADLTFLQFVDELFVFIDEHAVDSLILDLRYNGGGDSSLLKPLIKQLDGHPLNRQDTLFVIIGRGTFSSAVLNALEMRQKTEAVLVGEPTSGSASHYGEVKTFVLGNSRVRINYSTKFFSSRILVDDAKIRICDWLGAFGYASTRYPFDNNDGASVMPDVLVEPALDDELSGHDPVLAAILPEKE